MNCPENQYFFFKPHPTPGGPSGDFRGLAIQKVREMSWTAQKINNLFNPISHPVVGRFRAQNHPGGAVLGDTWREGGREGGRGGRGGEGRRVGGREGREEGRGRVGGREGVREGGSEGGRE